MAGRNIQSKKTSLTNRMIGVTLVKTPSGDGCDWQLQMPSTQKKDRTIKLREYRHAGVRECWLIDPVRQEVEVYNFISPEIAMLPKVYSFESKIPVGIWRGDCEIDFSQIYRRIRHLY